MAAGDGGPVAFVVHSPNMASVPFSERLRCEVSEAFRPSLRKNDIETKMAEFG